MDDLAEQLLDKATVVHLQPDDVLLVGNVGHDIDGRTVLDAFEHSLPNTSVMVFAENINVDLLRETCPHCARPEGYDACPVHRDHP